MNVMNRKLFANRDARRKLANMGGIMVSSPELMQAAQMFQVGGQATVLKTVAHPFGDYDIMSDGSAILKMTGSVIDPNNKSNTLLLEELKNLPAKGTENETSNILSGIFGGGGGNELSKENPYQADIDAAVESFTGASTNENSELSKENPYQADIDAAVESFTEASTNENTVPVFPPTDEQVEEVKKKVDKTDDVPVFPPTDEQVEEVKKKKLKDDPKTLEEFEQIRDSMDAVPEAGSKKQLKKIEKKVEEENEKDGDPVAAASSGILNTAGVDTSNMSRKERVESMKAMLSDLLGYDDEDQKEEFWLTMASIGFGIAAGQDSNALTNIAQGLAEGSSKLMENKATRQAREDKLTLTAFGEVLADERATTKFGRDLELAKVRASGSSSYSTVDRMFKSVLDNSLAAYKTQVEDGTITNEQAVAKAMADASTAFPDSQFANTTKLPPEETVDVIQNGKKITVPISQLPTQKKVLNKEG